MLNIDLLIGGSPCQGFSINGNRLNFQDERSALFFEFLRIKKQINPKYWLLENVATMSSDIKAAIDLYVGVIGKEINSNVYVPQNRKRLYWTNIPYNIPLNFPTNNRVSDLLENSVDKKLYWNDGKIARQFISPTKTDGVITLNPKMHSGQQTYQQDRIYDCNGRYVALTATLGGRFNVLDNNKVIRKLSIREQARLQGLPETYNFKFVSDSSASKCIGNGMTINSIENILKNVSQTR